jgi:D-alanyl-D-alanine carboxypeptidase
VRGRCSIVGLFAVVALGLSAGVDSANAGARSVPLVWHVETVTGKVLDSREAGRPVNPASVVKLAASLRALVKLGPEHRFATRFAIVEDTAKDGTAARRHLIVQGDGDPDFHFENAVLVARALEQAGAGVISGDLHLAGNVWIGWERGSAGRDPDPLRRREEMGRRLLQAWSPSRWSPPERRAWEELAARRGWDVARPPSVELRGRFAGGGPPEGAALLVEHRSQTLIEILRRFNVFSNNDIERLDATTGPASELAGFLSQRWGQGTGPLQFETTSGLGRNRMTSRDIVRLLHDLRAMLADQGREWGDLLPVLGCGAGTLRELFPRLRQAGDANGLAGKTGTLTTTDAGVSTLAGFMPVGPGIVFFVAAPGAGSRLPAARAAQEDWLRDKVLRHGGRAPLRCPGDVPTSDRNAEVVIAAARPAPG